MTDAQKIRLKKLICLKNNLLVFKKTNQKIPRVDAGIVELNRAYWLTADLMRMLLEDKRDRRKSESFDIARAAPNAVISRSDARGLMMTIYRTGKPCFKGHSSWRYVSTGACTDCKGHLIVK